MPFDVSFGEWTRPEACGASNGIITILAVIASTWVMSTPKHCGVGVMDNGPDNR